MTDGDLEGARAGFGFKIENDICPSTMERLKSLG
jgi:hypothetical protein